MDPAKLAEPIKEVTQKHELVPAFLKVRGLVRQHIDSFDDFVDRELRKIVRAKGNAVVTCDASPDWFFRFLDIHVGEPQLEDTNRRCTPAECRLRDLTYSAPIYAEVEYVRGSEVVGRYRADRGSRGSGRAGGGSFPSGIGGGSVGIGGGTGQGPIYLGRLPIMLRSRRCVLRRLDEAGLARAGECPLDPGGYFVVKGTEKVILIQEQLSKNRIVVDPDGRDGPVAAVTSSTHERKSKTHVGLKHGRVVLRHNAFSEDVNLAVALRAMGATSDQEILALLGPEAALATLLAPTLQAARREADGTLCTQHAALEWLGTKVRSSRPGGFGGGGGGGGAGGAGGGGGAGGAGAGSGRSGAASGPGSSSAGPRLTATGRPMRTKADEARDVLANVVVCHVPAPGYDFDAKRRYLGLMARRLLAASVDPSAADDRDYYGNKRLELAGGLLALLFEDLFKRTCADLKRAAELALSRAPGRSSGAFDAAKHVRTDALTLGLESALSSGNWTIRRFRMERRGVTQVLSRLSFIAALGMMTRISSQFEKTRKVSGPRALQPSQWGMLCPADTPEGEACGLVKNLALLAHVTTDADEAPVARAAAALGVVPASALAADEPGRGRSALVLLNGRVLGAHADPRLLPRALRSLRRRGRLASFASVWRGADGCVHVACDGGRVCRPLVVVDGTGRPRVGLAEVQAVRDGRETFEGLVRAGKVEFLDVNEENDSLVAVREPQIVPGKTTHLEIAPFTLLGVVAGLVPYPHHNQSPRNTYQCAMGKQALGAIGFNQMTRADTLLYLLDYTQRPLLSTRTIQLVGYDRLGAGQNAIVAVMSFSGYDIEDALVANRASLDRGFGRCALVRKHATSLKRYPNRATDRIAAPPPPPPERPGRRRGPGGAPPARALSGGSGRFAALDADGIAEPGRPLGTGEVLVNKQVPTVTRDILPAGGGGMGAGGGPGAPGGALLGGGMGAGAGVGGASLLSPPVPAAAAFRPAPVTWKGYAGERATVERVTLSSSDETPCAIKVMVRHARRPELGDKFSSRHGQKGVVGNIVQQMDMPFSERGLNPDLIMNPHGFPSRMTVGKMIELIGSKAGALDGRTRLGSAFGELDGLAEEVSAIGETLVEHGFSYGGKDLLHSGITGEPLQAYIFMGPVYYQKLKHMVIDKMHARARGPRVVLTRQPTEGRSHDGGLRLGEMERDCLIGYGASLLLLERLMISSDQFEVSICTTCGLMGYHSAKTGHATCPVHGVTDAMATMKLPYAAKLLFQELQAMNIVPRLTLGEA